MSVRGFLVTGPDQNLMDFHLSVCLLLNSIDRRRQTVRYTCLAEDADLALAAAQQADVSVQEIHGAADTETYQTLHTGTHGMVWERKLCMHEGCGAAAMACYLMEDLLAEPRVVSEYLCGTHAAQAGYCYVCGRFAAGEDGFDHLHVGLCDHCHDEVRADAGAEEEQDFFESQWDDDGEDDF